MSEHDLKDAAACLVRLMAEQSEHPRGFGSMSSSIYDTAWISMIQKPMIKQSLNDSTVTQFEWLFPDSFEAVLDSQHLDGGWPSYASPVDGILSTAAALLTIRKHLHDSAIVASKPDLALKGAKAEVALRRQLSAWNMGNCDHVGFEVLVTRHLEYLDDEGIVIDSPVRHSLKVLETAKLSKLPPVYVETYPSTLVHSLEALVGKVNYDRMRHLRSHGSMFGSPSSTAAYLMNISEWDDEAEEYLQDVVGRQAIGKQLPSLSGRGQVPCAWPTTIFEGAWVITALHDGGFSAVDLGEKEVSRVQTLIEKTLVEQEGIIGFSPGCLPDADDTARGLLAIAGLKTSVNATPMVTEFQRGQHFLTYPRERNPSFSTNCNVAAALLVQTNPSLYVDGIRVAILFLCTHAFEIGFKDKWNLSEIYPKMLFSQTLLRLLTGLDSGSLEWASFPETLLNEEIPILTLQMLGQILSSQHPDGSWDSKHEVTSYAILSLTALSPLPWMQSLELAIKIAISHGKRYLAQQRDRWTLGEYLWIEKVTYSSTTLSLAYCLSAAKSMPVLRQWGPKLQSLNIATEKAQKLSRFFGALPLYSTTPFEHIQTACLQSHFFLKRLQRLPLAIFAYKSEKKNYLHYVPFAWTACNNKAGGVLKPTVLEDMIQLSMIVYEADEFMETVIEEELADDLDGVKIIIRSLFSGKKANGDNQKGYAGGDGTNDRNAQSRKRKLSKFQSEDNNGESKIAEADSITSTYSTLNRINGCSIETITSTEANLRKAHTTLHKLTSHILTHPKVLTSHPHLQTKLAQELQIFLLAHIHHAEENAQFAAQKRPIATKDTETSNCKNAFVEVNGNIAPQVFLSPGLSFYNWVRTTSADHTSCPFAFIFYLCLISPPNTHPFPSARSIYVAEDLCHHLATMCRQYNDFGSVARDAAEGNLNSLNFPEFHQLKGEKEEGEEGGGKEAAMKKDLMWIAEYERGLLKVAMETLSKEKVTSQVLNAAKVFVDVTDLFGQIYVQKDLTAMKKVV